MRRRSTWWFVFLIAIVILLAGLRGVREGGRVSGRVGENGSPSRRALLVFAASSLKDAFARLAGEFEQSHPGVNVTLNFAGSRRLRAQIAHGAPADVFASADRRYLEPLYRQGLVETGHTFAHNKPVVVVPMGNPASIHILRELPQARHIVLGAPDVPIGRYAGQILQKASALYGPTFLKRVKARVGSYELNARQVLAKVALGEAEAGIVYRSDARAAGGRVEVIPIPADLNVTAEYAVTVVENTDAPRLARAWVDFMSSPFAQQALARHGFTPVEPQPSRPGDTAS